LDIRNIGVLMFAEHPEKFIPGSYIELIRFNTKEAEASDDFIEKTFTGPIWKQVQDALDYINTNVIEEKVVKLQGQAESERFFNYPYNALEEALVNAVFHKSYREQEPVEIRIYVDSIQILNYPGLAKWINLERFAEGRIKGRKYRNRRIGELFKEIDLSEKKGTGIPKILRELKKNGSPGPEFDMDDDRTYLNTIIHIRDGFDKNEIMSESMSKSMSESMSELEIARIQVILQYLTVHDTINSAKAAELLDVEKKTASRLLSKAEKVEVLISKGKTKDKVYMKK
jgi:ATP-dependent DNA helicase RecG